MSKQLLEYYKRFRAASPFMLVGHNAEQALSAANTLLAWNEGESAGLVRIVCEPEIDNYFDVHGEPDTESEKKRIVDVLERDGCWHVKTEYWDEERQSWEFADGVGMNTGYKDPCSPFENCYVIGMMQAALDKITQPEYSI